MFLCFTIPVLCGVSEKPERVSSPWLQALLYHHYFVSLFYDYRVSPFYHYLVSIFSIIMRHSYHHYYLFLSTLPTIKDRHCCSAGWPDSPSVFRGYMSLYMGSIASGNIALLKNACDM